MPNHVTGGEGKLILTLSYVSTNDGEMSVREIPFRKSKVGPVKVHLLSSTGYDCLVGENIEIDVPPRKVTDI